MRSRYVHRHHEIPRFRAGDLDWKSRLIELLDSEDFDLVIPCHDEDVLPLQLHQSELSRHARLLTLDEGPYRTVASKARSYELARSLGLPVPDQVLVTSRDAFVGLEPRFGWPVIVKPQYSIYEHEPGARARVRKAYSADELSVLVDSLLDRDETVIIQKHVRGIGVGVEVLCHDGKILVAFQHERVHEPPHGGGSSYRRGVPSEERLLLASQKVMAALGYTGVAMVEYKCDRATGEWSFMEINGRFWGSLPLAVASGADFPLFLYQMVVQGRREFPQAYRTDLYCRNLVNDLGWYLQNRRAEATDPTQIRLSTGQLVREIANIVLLRERSDTFVLDDPRPGFLQLGSLLKKATRRIRGWLTAKRAGVGLVRRRRQDHVWSALRAGGTLLIVCKGNVCRSPYAHRVARRVLPESVQIRSCGYYPVGGRKSPPEAVAAARRRGIDLTDHESRVIDLASVEQADLIAVFDQENREQLLSRYPRIDAKVFYLGSFLTDQEVFISDPWGGTIEEFDDTYTRIDRAFAGLADRLGRPPLRRATNSK